VARRLTALLLVVLAACGDGAGGSERAGAGAGRLLVVTTVAPVTSIVANVAGDGAEVRGVVPEGADSHTFEPPPSVAALLAEADLVLLNGLRLEEPTRRLAEANRRDGSRIVSLGDRTLDPDEHLYDDSFPEAEGRPNPHLWTNPPMALRYAEIVRDELSDLDPDGAAGYAARYEAFGGRVEELDAAMRESFESLAPGERRLLTYHDAYAYFAQEYGWEVVGAIQVADFGDPSPREVARLIDQVREQEVRAIFGSEVFPSPVLEQIGRETGVRYVDVLRDDDLPGRPGDPEHSWLGLMVFNYVTIVEALGGDASPLHAVDVRDVVPDRARYPQ
jgi:ABC-type Zn uptake system ZnuABC Zn-binding protein ZnuA